MLVNHWLHIVWTIISPSDLLTYLIFAHDYRYGRLRIRKKQWSINNFIRCSVWYSKSKSAKCLTRMKSIWTLVARRAEHPLHSAASIADLASRVWKKSKNHDTLFAPVCTCLVWQWMACHFLKACLVCSQPRMRYLSGIELWRSSNKQIDSASAGRFLPVWGSCHLTRSCIHERHMHL